MQQVVNGVSLGTMNRPGIVARPSGMALERGPLTLSRVAVIHVCFGSYHGAAATSDARPE